MKKHILEKEDVILGTKFVYSYYECPKCGNQIWLDLKTFANRLIMKDELDAEFLLDKFNKINLSNLRDVPNKNLLYDNNENSKETLFADGEDVYLIKYKNKKDIFRKFPCRWTDEEWLAKQIIE